MRSLFGATMLVAAAFGLRMLLDPLLGDRSPFLLFTFAVLVAGATLGARAGLVAAALSTLLGSWAFLPPRYSFGPMTADEWTNVAAFLMTSLAMLVFTSQLMRSRAAEAVSAAESQTTANRLAENRQRLAAIVDSAMDAIITIDRGQQVTLFNPAAERMFGYSASEMIGQPITRLIPMHQRAGHEAHVDRFRREGTTNRRLTGPGSLSGLKASGEEFPIEASISHVVVGGEDLTTVILRDITDRKLNEEAQTLLAREVDHRAKNALAVAQALVSLTRADTVAEYVQVVTGRIAALARAHSLLSRSRWTGASLQQVVCEEITPYARDEQIAITGPSIMLIAEAVQPLGMVVHELATNALKHGALSADGGLVSISWQVDHNGLRLHWQESGGPCVRQPTRLGFGSRLLEKTVRRQLEAELELAWLAGGLSAEIRLPARLFSSQEASDASASASDVQGRTEAEGKGRKVLVVEDEELVAFELCAELERLGWSVCGPAATIAEAEDILVREPGVEGAILDVNLRGRPVYPLAEDLVRRNMPFVFCTGYEIVDPAGRFPNTPVVRKPSQPAATAAALDRLLSAAQGKAALRR
jgi:PAS domain S-box-containing protein